MIYFMSSFAPDHVQTRLDMAVPTDSALYTLQTTEDVPGLLVDWSAVLHIHMAAVVRGKELQGGSLLWSDCDRLWSHGMSEPGRVFAAHAYSATQELAKVRLDEPCVCA